jgi:methylmalonyl-CoA/ethylmalonyl-CoA epimerase
MTFPDMKMPPTSRRTFALDDTQRAERPRAAEGRPVEENLTRLAGSAIGSAYDDGPMSSTVRPDIPEHLFTAIDHVGIAVADLDEAMAFYRDTFGMETVHEEVNEEQGVREAMVAVGDSGSCIQLLAPLDETSTIAKFLDRHGPGIQQLAYRVTDVEAVSAVLRERGLRVLYDVAKGGTAGSLVNFVHPQDAGGVLIELVEPASPA